MTRPLSQINRVPAGPEHADLTAAWTVLEGLVIIRGEQTIRIPAGGTWPGEDALPRDVARHLGVIDTTAVQGTAVTRHVTPAAIEAGQALVLAQALMIGAAPERLPLMLERFDLTGVAQSVGAAVINVSRKHFLRLIHTNRS